MKQSNPRRQVSFNIEEELYNEFKKRMLDDHTTPTAYLTRCIRERVERETWDSSTKGIIQCKESTW